MTLGWVVHGEGDAKFMSLEGLEGGFLKGGCVYQILMAMSFASRNHVEEDGRCISGMDGCLQGMSGERFQSTLLARSLHQCWVAALVL